MLKTGYDMLYLAACGIHGITPDTEKFNSTDMEKLLKVCKFHSLSALVCYALESAGINDPSFQKEKNLAIRNIVLLDVERKNLCEFFKKNEIWYMPLKGIYLKNYYPKIGMRQMCDNDILVDLSKMNDIDKFMTQRGYTMHSSKVANDYGYLKLPCYNFEMHRSLFGVYDGDTFYNYYTNIKEKLIPSKSESYEYNFTPEDFYIFMTAHEYKHFSKGGTGLRSLVDVYIYVRKFSDTLNWDYIRQECKKLEIAEFEEKSRKLSLRIFSSAELPELTEDEQKMLEYYLSSGTYGTNSNKALNTMEKIKSQSGSSSKLGFIFHRIFPPLEHYKYWFPFFYKHKILLPIGWAYRLIRGIFCKSDMAKAEMRTINNIEKDAQD